MSVASIYSALHFLGDGPSFGTIQQYTFNTGFEEFDFSTSVKVGLPDCMQFVAGIPSLSFPTTEVMEGVWNIGSKILKLADIFELYSFLGLNICRTGNVEEKT